MFVVEKLDVRAGGGGGCGVSLADDDEPFGSVVADTHEPTGAIDSPPVVPSGREMRGSLSAGSGYGKEIMGGRNSTGGGSNDLAVAGVWTKGRGRIWGDALLLASLGRGGGGLALFWRRESI